MLGGLLLACVMLCIVLCCVLCCVTFFHFFCVSLQGEPGLPGLPGTSVRILFSFLKHCRCYSMGRESGSWGREDFTKWEMFLNYFFFKVKFKAVTIFKEVMGSNQEMHCYNFGRFWTVKIRTWRGCESIALGASESAVLWQDCVVSRTVAALMLRVAFGK